MSTSSRRVLIAASAVLTTGCGAATGTPGVGPVPASAQMADSAGAPRDRTMVPTGFGSLRQEEATVAIRQGAVLLKVVPLDEATLRLLAPDTYNRLHSLREARIGEARRATSQPELFLVSFFSYQPDMAFQPEDVQLMHQARLLRSLAILPQTTGWGQMRLGQQETQAAIYVFEGPIDYEQQIIVRYKEEQSNDWQHIISKLESERARIRSRVRF